MKRTDRPIRQRRPAAVHVETQYAEACFRQALRDGMSLREAKAYAEAMLASAKLGGAP